MDTVVYNKDIGRANFTAKVWKENGHSYLNASADIFEDLEKVILTFIFAIGSNENDKNYENVMMRSTVNTCKMHEGNRANFIIKMLMDQFTKTADFNFTCPFPKVKS